MKKLFIAALIVLASTSLAFSASVKRQLSGPAEEAPASSGPTKTGDDLPP